MGRFDEIPGRDRNHELEDEAIAAFQKRLAENGAFVFQGGDQRDYGTDCQIEVLADRKPTNVRVHVQLKGTERDFNADGSLSIDVRRTNLNYLLMQPCSVYIAYHAPTRALRIRSADSVARQYEHGGTAWTDQQTVTVSFTDELTNEHLTRLADLAQSTARSSRDRRIDQAGVAPGALSDHVLQSPPDVHVPEESALARRLLVQLYDRNADEEISAGFTRFAAVLGADSDEMGVCYMSEINLGMDGLSRHPERIEAAIPFFQARLASGRHQGGDLHYTIGNAYHALRNEEAAKTAFEAALADPELGEMPALAAQFHKNLGSSFSILGDQDKAVEHYREALRLDPHLAEAHNSLGTHYVRLGQFDDALRHLDQVVFSDQKQGRTSAVVGWRANVHFNLGDGRAAFRDINGLVAKADSLRWVWPWCSRLVAAFGRANVDNARQAEPFWQRYVSANPDDPAGRWELLMTTFYLRGEGEDVGKSYAAFCEEFDRHISLVEGDNAALPWDRLGHWAQDIEDWTDAERCFREAYNLAGSKYGYCLAIALKELGRFEESVPLLLEQAQTVQPDAMSWFQLATSYADLARWPDSIEAYEHALALDPDYAVALFDLGGAHWNSGNVVAAIVVWTEAIERFPDHELAAKLERDFPMFFGHPPADETGDADRPEGGA